MQYENLKIFNVVHWAILGSIVILIIGYLRNMGKEDVKPKYTGAIIAMVICMYLYEQIPQVASYHDLPNCPGIMKFVVKVLIGMFLTFIGIKGMHEHHEEGQDQGQEHH